MSFTTCDEVYRNVGTMQECPEPHVWDTVDWFNRAARDQRVVRNQLASMRMPSEDVEYEN